MVLFNLDLAVTPWTIVFGVLVPAWVILLISGLRREKKLEAINKAYEEGYEACHSEYLADSINEIEDFVNEGYYG